MAKSQTTVRDERQELTRRALIKWTVAAGAALGVSRSKIYDILEKTAGKGIAMAASERQTCRTVFGSAGNGGLAHMQLFWPQNDVAAARNPAFAWHKVGMEQLVPGTDNPLTVGPDTPWTNLPAQRQITGFVCGATETHVSNVQSSTTLNGASVLAIATVLQQTSNSVIPAIAIGDASYGAAPGAPTPARVGTADGVTSLFNSAASQANGLLTKMADAQLYKAHYDAFYQLNRAANRQTTKKGYLTASNAAEFLGTNLSLQLAITPEDLARYGVVQGTTRGNVAAIARAFIVTAKSFKMDLTNSVTLPIMRDDPHGLFNGDQNVVPPQLKKVFQAFMDDLDSINDDATGTPLSRDTVICITGDTPKNCLDRNGWPDNTPRNSNLMFVYSAGHLKSGWVGGIDRAGNVRGVGADGKSTAAYDGAMSARYATAAVAFAAAKRDERLISPFANGITIGGTLGRLKNQ